jgi:hypothetical protein
VTRDQHLGGLKTELHFLEESLFRAEQNRAKACRDPDASRITTPAYARCQFMDQLYEQLKNDIAPLRTQYFHGVSGSGGLGR